MGPINIYNPPVTWGRPAVYFYLRGGGGSVSQTTGAGGGGGGGGECWRVNPARGNLSGVSWGGDMMRLIRDRPMCHCHGNLVTGCHGGVTIFGHFGSAITQSLSPASLAG